MPDVFTSFNDYQWQREVFLPRVNLDLAASPLFQSGLLTRDPVLDAFAAGEALTFQVPTDNPAAADDQMYGEGDVVQAFGLNGGAMKGVRTLRQTAWGYYDHSMTVGADPAGKVKKDAVAWTINKNVNIVFAVLAGLFGTGGALNDTAHLYKAASESLAGQSATTKFSGENLLTAKQTTFGESAGALSIILCNSYVFLQMQLRELATNVTTVTYKDKVITFATWLGHTVVVLDAVTSRAGTTDGRVYRTYCFGAGVLRYGDGLHPNHQATEYERTASAAKNKVIYRRGFVIHPDGCSFVGSPAEASAGATNVEYGTPANWSQVLPDGAIKIMAFDSN